MVAPCPGLVTRSRSVGSKVGPGERPLPDSSRAEDWGGLWTWDSVEDESHIPEPAWLFFPGIQV